MEEANPFYHKLQNSKNILLVRDDVGKAKRGVRDLPGSDHFFGSSLKKDIEGAGEIISSWQEHKPTEVVSGEKDFKRLNKLTLNQKMTTPKQVSQFVKNSDLKIQERRGSTKPVSNFRSLSNGYFGVPNKPGTPIDQVVSHGFGNEAAIENSRIYQSNFSRPQQKPRSVFKETDQNRTPEEKKVFKMKKFQFVGAKICSGISKDVNS
jgi:hypothetical protein